MHAKLVYVCVYIIYIYMHVCMCVRAHAYKCVNVCMSVSVPVCVSVCVSICVCVCLCKSFCLEACMGRFICVWTHYIITNKPTESVSVLATKTLLFGIQLLDHMKPSFLKHASLSCAKALVSICLNSSVFFCLLVSSQDYCLVKSPLAGGVIVQFGVQFKKCRRLLPHGSVWNYAA